MCLPALSPSLSLRKAAATRLANAGCSVEMIKAVTGHKTAKEVERYVKQANQALLAEQALKLQIRAEQRRTEIVQRRTQLDKTGG